MKDFIKDKIREGLIESILDEDYPTTWNVEDFKKLNSFNTRVRYCEANLQRISSGSARIVYKIDDEKVLKLAKNKKGIAQNGAETQWMNDYYFDEILAKIIDADPNDLWVEMELARKVTPQMFKSYFGFDINIIFKYLTHRFNINNGRKSYFGDVSPEIADVLSENRDIQTIYEFADACGSVGDLGKLSSYGLVKRGGHDSIVIIDFGLNNDVWKSYYS